MGDPDPTVHLVAPADPVPDIREGYVDSVDVSGTPLAATTGEARTPDDWRQALTTDAWNFHEAFAGLARDRLGPIVIDYSPKSYIGIRVGRRVWAPLWPRKDGAQIYLPDPDQSRNEESPAYARFRELLAEHGFNLGWQTTYNAGANPISVRLRATDLTEPAVLELLAATYHAVQPNATPWSQRTTDTDDTSPAAATDTQQNVPH